MNTNEFVMIKRAIKPIALPEILPQSLQQLDSKPVQPLEIEQPEQPEQPEPIAYLEPVVEFALEESVYGSGWSLAELMDEFNHR